MARPEVMDLNNLKNILILCNNFILLFQNFIFLIIVKLINNSQILNYIKKIKFHFQIHEMALEFRA